MSPRTRNFFQAVASHISGRLKGDGAEPAVSKFPELVQLLTDEQRVTVILLNEFLVREANIIKYRMMMRAISLVAILTALVVSDSATVKVLSQALKEFLDVGVVQ